MTKQTVAKNTQSASAAVRSRTNVHEFATAGLQHATSNQAMQRVLRTGGIQAKLTVNEPGDRFEQEADRIADHVMRMPDSGTEEKSSAPGRSSVQIQRICSSCEDEKNEHVMKFSTLGSVPLVQQPTAQTTDRIQRQENQSEEDNEEPIEELELQRKECEPGRVQVNSQVEDRIRNSETSGRALPETVRLFFEKRMGRDLSGVRVHTGSEAANMNREIRAYAFTHRNHVWLRPGLPVDQPSHILAHELAHVVQQTNPPIRKTSVPARQVTDRASENSIQRFLPYWEPASYNGTRTHSEVLPQLGRQASIFTEAPVPNADRLSSGFGKRGFADLYAASTTVGVFFHAHQAPAALFAPGNARHNGQPYARSHLSQSAPRVNALRDATNVDRAPTDITVGDLKPSHGTIEALEGEGQVRRYLAGFRLAASEVTELAGHSRTTPAGAVWRLSESNTHLFSRTQLRDMTPENLRSPATGQTARAVVLKQGASLVRPIVRATGKLVLEPDPSNAGILNYVWVPSLPPSFTLPPRLRALGESVRLQIINPLRRPPAAGSIRETFNLGEWRTNRRRITRDFRLLRNSPDVATARQADLVTDAHRGIQSSTGLNITEPTRETRETARAMDQIEFWTSAPAGLFGTFRRIFGRTFVRISNGYDRIRTRFTNWLRARSAPGTGGGLMGAAIKAAFTVLKMAGVFILNRTMSVLSQSLLEGVSRKIQQLIPEEIGELQERVQQVSQLYGQLMGQAVQTAEDLVERLLPNFAATMEQIQRVTEIVSSIGRIVTLVRWGARAIACLSPPALGCLWALALSVLEELAALVVQTCWFQRKIAPLIARVNFIRDLPRTLAREIIAGIRSLLPGSLSDVFADVSASEVNPEQIECDDSEGGGRPITDEQQAVLDLQERLGEERFLALMDLLRSSNIAAGTQLSRALADQLGQFVEQEGFTAADLRRLASNPRGAPVELNRLLENLRAVRGRSPVEPVRPQPEEEEAVAEGPEYTTEVVGSPADAPSTEPQPGGREPGESQSGEASRDAPAGARADVREATARPTDIVGGQRVTGWSIQIVRVVGRLVAEQIVRIDLQMSRSDGRRRVVRVFRNLQVRVTEIVPSERNPSQHEAFLEVESNQQFGFRGGESYVYEQGREFVYPF